MHIENMTPIHRIDRIGTNELYIKREDLIPYSFGGNKVRKALLFFEEIDRGDYDTVVTYGSSSSNHVRAVSNLCAQKGYDCLVISPEETSEVTFNSRLRNLFGAKTVVVPVNEVSDTIDRTLEDLRNQGKKPYFIPGGGHGNLGTEAYVQCYEEIRRYEKESGIFFNYIFFASGTGTTQAGLVCGLLKHRDDRKIVGISIARKNPRGRDVILASIREYLGSQGIPGIEEATVFIDRYTGEGYGSDEASDTVRDAMVRYGIPMDRTYTGKAFRGMKEYILENDIRDQNILFIHTGGTPLFFDTLL